MALNFPSSPSLNQQYTVGTRTWIWNGVAWKLGGSIGISGYSGYSGQDGNIGVDGASGYSGFSGYSGQAGVIGVDGASGYSGYSGAVLSWVAVTSNYTASNLNRIIADTTGGSFTITLPSSPSTGNYVIVTDGGDWEVNNLIIDGNGSTIEGYNDTISVDIKNISVELIYSGTTWQITATTGRVGDSGWSGYSGTSGYSGINGISGYSGYSGTSGYSGISSTVGKVIAMAIVFGG